MKRNKGSEIERAGGSDYFLYIAFNCPRVCRPNAVGSLPPATPPRLRMRMRVRMRMPTLMMALCFSGGGAVRDSQRIIQ